MTPEEAPQLQATGSRFFRLSLDPLCTANLDGYFHQVSPAMETLLDRTASELTSRPYLDFIHEADHADTQAHVAKVIETGNAPGGFENRYRHRDGSYRWLAWSARLETEEGLIYAVAKDVTERKRMEDDLRDAEERFRSAFDHAPVGMALIGLRGEEAGRLLQVNRALSEITGHPESELLEMGIEELVHPDDLVSVRQLIEGVALGRRDSAQAERRLVHASGRTLWILGSLSLVRDRDGEPVYLIKQAHDVTGRKEAEEQLARQAVTDPLSGLPNRTLFFDRLGVALRRTPRTDGGVAVLFIDLDDLKTVNDSLGHDAGDRVLMAVADRLSSVIRPSDTLARFGGDEFTVVCDEIRGRVEATELAERVTRAVSERYEIDGREIFLTASIGIALSRASGDTPETLVRDADAALYRAKARGKARYEVFDSAMRNTAIKRLEMQNDLRGALERSELRLVFQPEVELEGGAVTGFEALLRWDHPRHGTLPPADFIPLAEETGAIISIGRWVLEEACRQAVRWRALTPDGPPFRVAVNLAARQLGQSDLVSVVSGVLQSTGCPASLLRLELTEGALIEDPDLALTKLEVLTHMGIETALDDFGTGFSSLNYLKRFSPVHVLKIDKSFVDGLGHDSQDRPIVASVVALTKALGLLCTAEGVETAEQLADLRALDCDRAQGFLFARPAAVEQIDAIVSQGFRLEGS